MVTATSIAIIVHKLALRVYIQNAVIHISRNHNGGIEKLSSINISHNTLSTPLQKYLPERIIHKPT